MEKEIEVKMQKVINGHKSADLVKWCLENPDDYVFIPRMIPTEPARREEALEHMKLEIGVHNKRDTLKSFGFYLDTEEYIPREKIIEILKGFYGQQVVNNI